jgi:uncharacterized membrane protein YhaH (DUF805 family)
MAIKDKLPVSYLLFTKRGRIDRLTYCVASIFIWSTFYLLFRSIELFISADATLILFPILFWAVFATSTKRLHDINKSGKWLLLVLIPVLGLLVLIVCLGFIKGKKIPNQYGDFVGSNPDYYKNDQGINIEHLKTNHKIINDVTQLNPIVVNDVFVPKSIFELQDFIKNTKGSVSVGGGRFSMGGQTASVQSTHIDTRALNKIISFSKEEKTIKVEAGIRWCDIQRFVDQHDLSIKIMQTYANFTVGGSLSVNCHGRYIGLGPLILSVKSIDLILANVDSQFCSPDINSELFFASIGCYNAIGIIANVEFELSDNVPVKREFTTMKREKYHDFFMENIRDNKSVVFHNGDIYPPLYQNVRAVSWVETKEQPTVQTRLMPLDGAYPLERYFINAFSKSNFGKWRREYIIDPLVYLKKKIHWRNYEAGYDVLELEPESRKYSTYVLQEYFIPVNQFDVFTPIMAEIFQRHQVNVINVSIRHALKDNGSLLAWAKEEVFAFVIWYKQYTTEVEKNKVGVWTRELIDAALKFNGAYYLPYQVHATEQQFYQAYPNAQQLMKLKAELDPDFKFKNVIWDTYFNKQNYA